MRIDMHTHSNVSDGTETPAELMRAARVAGLDVVALTDHDTVAGWEQASAEAVAQRVALVPGIEISCERDGRSVHLLGYLVDPASPGLSQELERVREARSTRLQRTVELLAQAGIPVTYAEVLVRVRPDATPGRPHIADALVASGVVGHRDEAFERWLHNGSPFYVRHYAPDPLRALGLVRDAGGVAVLAHPFNGRPGRSVPDDLVVELAGAGLAGIEAYHPDHDAEASARVLRLAAELGLLATGSSDYHGSGKTNRLGQCTTDPEVLQELQRRASGHPVVQA